MSELVIDHNLRKINIPNDVIVLGVESDDDVERLYFTMPKMYGEFDLSQFNIYINYLNAKNEGDMYVVSDKVVKEDQITFSWLIGRNAVKYKGNTHFIVCLKLTDSNGIVQHELNTSVASLPVLEGLETNEQVIQKNADIIEQILQQIDSGTLIPDEKIYREVNDFLTTHPVQASDEQVTTSVEGWIENHPEATTTVQDKSITVKKLAEDVIEKLDESNDWFEDVVINDMPSGVTKPIISEEHYVNTDVSNQVIVKPAMMMYADRFFFPYTEAIDGTTDDLPIVGGDGKTAVNYRKFWRYKADQINDDVTGTIAQIDTNYTDYNGANATAVGGAGYSSAIHSGGYNGKVYFSFIENGKDGVSVNNKSQHFVPCCVDVVINSTTPIGTIKELTLTIDGKKGQFDLARLGYQSYRSYYTTIAPTSVNGAYMWAQPVPNGVAIFDSTDGINWTYRKTHKLKFDPYFEIALACGSKTEYVMACRTNYDKQAMYLVYVKKDEISYVYRFEDVGSRPYLARINRYYYFMHSTTSRDNAECIQIVPNGNYGLYFYRWFEIDKKMCYYPIIFTSTTIGFGDSFAKFYLVGNNGIHTKRTGMSWAILTTDKTKPYLASECEGIRSDSNLVVASETTLGGVKPVSKMDTMTQDVGVDDEGKLYTTPSSGGGSAEKSFKLLGSITIDENNKTLSLSGLNVTEFIIHANDATLSNTYLPISINGSGGNARAQMWHSQLTNAKFDYWCRVITTDVLYVIANASGNVMKANSGLQIGQTYTNGKSTIETLSMTFSGTGGTFYVYGR